MSLMEVTDLPMTHLVYYHKNVSVYKSVPQDTNSLERVTLTLISLTLLRLHVYSTEDTPQVKHPPQSADCVSSSTFCSLSKASFLPLKAFT